LLKELKIFVPVFLISLAVFSAIGYLAQVPEAYDQYFALYTLGSAGLTEHYFPRDVVDIIPGFHMSWYVGVYNHMGTVRLVRVVFKLLNLTMLGPNEANNTASRRESFYEITRLLVSNETWILPVNWSVLNATTHPNATEIHSLTFNGQVLTGNVDVEALYGYNYRIVIELWVYDDSSGNFSFAWIANGEERSAYNQIWFNMTRISLLP
jgi:hypothetical protein